MSAKMRNMLVLDIILMVFLACLPVSALVEPDYPLNKGRGLDDAKEQLKKMASQSEEMLNQSQEEYERAKNASGINSTAIGDFEAMMSRIERLIAFLNNLIDSAVTIIDRITSFTKEILPE